MKENGSLLIFSFSTINFVYIIVFVTGLFVVLYSIIALRKAKKEEEKRAREKIRQKLEEDKVLKMLFHYSLIYSAIPHMIMIIIIF